MRRSENMTVRKLALRSAYRKGFAPLEMAMIFPTMMALIVLILYVGKASVDQLEFRNKIHLTNWQDRYNGKEEGVRPLVFTPGQGKLEMSDEKTIKTSTIYDKWKHKKSAEDYVFSNSWSMASQNSAAAGSTLFQDQKNGNNQSNHSVNLPASPVLLPIRVSDYGFP